MRRQSRLQKLEQSAEPEKPFVIRVCWTDEEMREAEAEAERNGEQLITIRYVDWPPDTIDNTRSTCQ